MASEVRISHAPLDTGLPDYCNSARRSTGNSVVSEMMQELSHEIVAVWQHPAVDCDALTSIRVCLVVHDEFITERRLFSTSN